METDQMESRSLEDVKKVLGFAKLDETELKLAIQCMEFVPELDNDSVKLLEMDADVASELHQGQSVVIRGSKTDSAVLCTNDKTFEVRDAETSNCMLVLPACTLGEDLTSEAPDFHLQFREVVALKQDYYELRLIKPRLKKLQRLLEENMYSGPECERDEDHQGHKYTYQELLEEVQASESEVNQGLENLQAFSIDGCWRMLDFDFMNKVLMDILSIQDEEGWSYDAIQASVCCEKLAEIYPRNVVIHVLRCQSDLSGEKLHTDSAQAEQQTYKLSEDKVCRFFAELLLRPVEQFELNEFTEVWKLAVPEGMSTSLYQLTGMALVERDTRPEVIRYFPAANLPEDIGDRFNKLFKTKAKWTLDNITPFIQDLSSATLTVGAMLMKYARASTQNGIKMFSSKQPLS